MESSRGAPPVPDGLEGSVAGPEPGGRAVGALLNLFLWPGIGHFAAGRFLAGSLWAATSLVLILGAPFSAFLPLLGMAGCRIASAVDVAARRPGSPPARIRVAWVLAGLIAAGGAFAAIRIHYLEGFKIPSVGMAPTLAIGDHVWAFKLAYRLGEIERGDVIVYVEPCNQDRDMAHRVIGLPGDTVEVRCDVAYVNGRPQPQRLVPGDCQYWDLEGRSDWKQRDCTRYVETIDGRDHEILQALDRPEHDRARAELPDGEEPLLLGSRDFPLDELPSCADVGDGRQRAEPAPGRIESSPRPASTCAPHRHYVVPAGHVFVMGDNRDNSADSRHAGPVPVELVKGRVLSIWWSSGTPADGPAWGRIGDVR